MPIELPIPPGYVTRPQAAERYNRSKRQLQRDLDHAFLAKDEKVLSHFKLVTKDGKLREAASVDKEEIQRLHDGGDVPVWCIEEAWLEKTFGRKGEPTPTKRSAERKRGEPQFDAEPPQPSGAPASSEEVTFLKEQLRLSEKRFQQEVERGKEREAKLHAQLEVKDKQISQWDELTQGIIRGLATGQIKPSLTLAPAHEPANKEARERAAVAVKSTSDVPSDEPPSASSSQPKRIRAKRQTASPAKKGSRKREPTGFEKFTPTFHRAGKALSKFLQRP